MFNNSTNKSIEEEEQNKVIKLVKMEDGEARIMTISMDDILAIIILIIILVYNNI